MPDELDPQLSRWFAKSNQPLPQADFHARFVEKLNRSRSWMAPARALTSIVRAILLGIARGSQRLSPCDGDTWACWRRQERQ